MTKFYREFEKFAVTKFPHPYQDKNVYLVAADCDRTRFSKEVFETREEAQELLKYLARLNRILEKKKKMGILDFELRNFILDYFN